MQQHAPCSPQPSLTAPVVSAITPAIIDSTMTHDDNYANDNDCNNIDTASKNSVNDNNGGEKTTGECDN